jgi:hypothetical protein
MSVGSGVPRLFARRSRLAVIAIGLLVVACSEPEPAPGADVTATDHCGPAETIPIQGEGHLVGDQEPPVPYNSVPPTSGWHTSGDVEFTVYGPEDALTEPEQVTVLELGGVLISYAGLPEEEVAALAQLVTDQHAGKTALTPYDQLEAGEIALTAWGKVQRCDAVDEAAISAFVEAYAQDAG